MLTVIKKVLAMCIAAKWLPAVATALCVLLAFATHRAATTNVVTDTYTHTAHTVAPVSFAMAYDAEDVEDFSGKLGETEDAALFSVTVKADGVTTEHETSGGTVGEFLLETGINVRENDVVTPTLDTLLQPGDVIRVKRRAYITRRVREPVAFQVLRSYSLELDPGEEQVLQEGEEGLRLATYAQTPDEDGNEGEEYLHSEEILRKPVHEKILTGFKVKPVSQMDFSWSFDENGEPVDYKTVFRGLRAAGYSAPAGARTASGRVAKVGHVAVDPNQIPYGSKLYIASDDGKFIYGYAIAADTGTALQQGVIGVDLFYDSYEASAQNGIKIVDIFVLE